MQVTLLGTGDTTGTPTPGCDCDTCREARDPGEETRRRLRERGIDPNGGVERGRRAQPRPLTSTNARSKKQVSKYK